MFLLKWRNEDGCGNDITTKQEHYWFKKGKIIGAARAARISVHF